MRDEKRQVGEDEIREDVNKSDRHRSEAGFRGKRKRDRYGRQT